MSRKLTPEEKAARAKSRNIARLDRKLIEYWKWRQDNLDLRHLPTLHELHQLHGKEFGDRMMAQDFGTDVDTLRQRRRALMPPEFAALVAEIRPLMKPVNKAIEKHKLARRKVEKKLERERWWKDHPQWCLADLDRVL